MSKHPVAPRRIYVSTCARLEVYRDARNEFSVYIDGCWMSNQATKTEAQQAGHNALQGKPAVTDATLLAFETRETPIAAQSAYAAYVAAADIAADTYDIAAYAAADDAYVAYAAAADAQPIAAPAKPSKRTPAAPHITYTSPCGRIRVEQHAPRDVWAFVDERFIGARTTRGQAEFIAHELLYSLLRTEAIITADEQAERDAITEALLERDEDAAAYGEDRAAAEAERYSAYGWR